MLTSDLLPPALAARLSALTPMRLEGGEAHLLRVRDSAQQGVDRVLKVYFPHVQPDPQVWSQLSAIRSPHVVEVVETGTLADGRFFELMEYLPAGSLRNCGAGRHAFETARIVEMVRQLAAGLGELHRRAITHRDLKPENVLVRGALDGTFELVLTDFGLSRRLDASAHFTTGARTASYAAPEAYAGHVSTARDWWSLGIMVLELVTGQEPFAGLDERMVQKAVTTKPVPVDGIADPRLQRLCAGLLVSDESTRWNHEQVRDWLGGGSPAVPDRRVRADVIAFEFDGQRYLTPETLAVAMARNWRVAARRYGISPSPSWNALTSWLHQFNDPDQYPAGVVEDRLELLNTLETSTEVPNAKLVRLLAGLNPAQPPIYRQAHVDPAKLRELARQAQDGPPEDPKTQRAHEVIGELWDGTLLEVLARFDGAAELWQVSRRWAAAVQQLNAVVAELRRDPRLATAFSRVQHRPAALAATLELAAGAARGQDWVHELRRRAQALPEPVGWFSDLVRWAGDDPMRAYAGLHVSGMALAEAQQVMMERQRAEQARLAREQAWADHERRRLDGRDAAIRSALVGLAVLTGLWLLAGVFGAASTAGLISLVVVLAVHYSAEIWLAQLLAADYQPTYSLRQFLARVAGQVGGRMRFSPRRWALGIIGGLVLLSLVSVLMPLAALAAGIWQLCWTASRHRRWTSAHAQDQQRVLSQ